jgi:VWFA-related protein
MATVSRKILLLVLGALLAQVALAGDAQEFNISQATARGAQVKVYLDVLDAQGEPVTGLQPANFSATLGRETVRLTEITPFEASGEGVAYIFLIDISKSLASTRFAAMREAIKMWVAQMNEKDRAAIVAFGDGVKLLADFTGRKDDLTARLDAIELKDNKTQLHAALMSALEMGQRGDSGLPDRRVIVVLSDGKDEGSGVMVDDVLARLQHNPVPIYAIGYSSLSGQERQLHFGTLHRFAQSSGGALREADAASLADIYATLKGAIRRVFVATISGDNGLANGQSQRLQINLKQNGKAFSDGLDINLFPIAAPVEPAPGPEAVSLWKRIAWWGYGLAGLGLLALVGVGLRLRKKRAASAESTDFESLGKAEERIVISGKPVRLLEVRGYNAGQVYHLQLGDRLLIGRRQDCALALTHDESVSSQHCELLQVSGRMIIKDLQSMNGTEVNGIAIHGRHRLESGDTITVGDTELRITFEG